MRLTIRTIHVASHVSRNETGARDPDKAKGHQEFESIHYMYV